MRTASHASSANCRAQNRWQDCPHAPNAYLVSARIDGDMSLMLTSWNEGIRPWQFNLGGGSGAEPVMAHTVFDRALFRAGETVSMKHVIRRRVGTGFAAVETRNLPRQLQLIHSGSGQRFELAAHVEQRHRAEHMEHSEGRKAW